MTNIDNITQTIGTIPEPGHRGIDTNNDFVIKQEAYQDHQRDDLQPELEALRGQLNTSIGQINTVSGEIETARDTAVSSALLAQGLANNKGAWSNLTGALNIPAAVNHNGSIWVLNNNIADITLSEPNEANTDYTESSGVTQSELDVVIGSVAQNSSDIAQNSSDIQTKTNTSINLSTTLKGNFALSNTIKTLIFDGFLYTGNGTTKDIITGMESVDFTVSGNGNGYWHDRTAGDCTIKDDAGTIVESGSLKLVKLISKVHIKERNSTSGHFVCDGLRGVLQTINTDTRNADYTTANSLTAFNNNGVTLGSAGILNESASFTYILYQTLYTHIRWGLSNQGKRYIEVYNPVSNENIIMVVGGIGAGEIIPTSLGTKLDYFELKDLDGTTDGKVYYGNKDYNLELYSADGSVARQSNPNWVTSNIDNLTFNTAIAGGTTIIYGKAKSETWDIEDNGTSIIQTQLDQNGGVIEKIIKNTTTTGNWEVIDYKRGNTKQLLLNTSDIETTVTADVDVNGTEGSKVDLPTDTTQLQCTDGIFSISNGIDATGSNNEIGNINGTIIPTNGWEDGMNYAYTTTSGIVVATTIKPLWGVVSINGNYNIDGEWYNASGTLYSPQITYLNQNGKLLGVEVADGNPVDLHLTEDAPSIVEKCIQVEKLITKGVNSILPTVDPFVLGEQWNDNGIVKISAGA